MRNESRDELLFAAQELVNNVVHEAQIRGASDCIAVDAESFERLTAAVQAISREAEADIRRIQSERGAAETYFATHDHTYDEPTDEPRGER